MCLFWNLAPSRTVRTGRNAMSITHILVATRKLAGRGPREKKGVWEAQKSYPQCAEESQEAGQQLSLHDCWSAESYGAGCGHPLWPQCAACPPGGCEDAEQGCCSKTEVGNEDEEEEADLVQEVQALDYSGLGKSHVFGWTDFQDQQSNVDPAAEANQFQPIQQTVYSEDCQTSKFCDGLGAFLCCWLRGPLFPVQEPHDERRSRMWCRITSSSSWNSTALPISTKVYLPCE